MRMRGAFRESGGRAKLGALLLTLILTACASPAQPAATTTGTGAAPAGSAAQAAPRVARVTVAIRAELPTLSKTLNTILPGATALDRLVSAGLTTTDDRGIVHPQLAEAVPTLANGAWKVLPDGRMETTWRIREGARWHDDTPVTADDMAFTVAVGQDREIAVFNSTALASLDRVEVRDPGTVTVHWKQPFIDADLLFSASATGEATSLPLPKHVLERAFLDDKAAFTDQPYWSQDFVGSGPFKVRDWAKGSHVTLVANEHYVLGRPKIDQIDVKFIADGPTVMANLLAAAVDLTIGERNFSLEEAVQAGWSDGVSVPGSRNPIVAFPQLLNPNPAIVENLQFRRALLHAIDRQEMANTFQAGQGEVAHGYVSPDYAGFPEVQAAVVRYDYDVRRTGQLLEELGYRRGSDGFFADSAGSKPTIEIRTTTLSENTKAMLAVADYWQRAGVATEPHIIPLARAQEAEYRATFPGFELIRQPKLEVITRIHSSRARLPQNNFRTVGGFNYPRYLNPEFDALLDRFYVTISWPERMEVLRQIVHRVSDQVIVMGMFYSTEANLVSNRLDQAAPTLAWNAHEWTVK